MVLALALALNLSDGLPGVLDALKALRLEHWLIN